jgi:Tfp pilus assembly protein PilE
MEQQPRKGLTIIQLMSLVALLGIALTIAAWLWSGPENLRQSSIDSETQRGVADSR